MSNQGEPSRKSKRAYAFSCTFCRQRKIACDGQKPTCGACLAAGTECNVPPVSRYLRRASGPVHEVESAPKGSSKYSDEDVARLFQLYASLQDRVQSLEMSRESSISMTPEFDSSLPPSNPNESAGILSNFDLQAGVDFAPNPPPPESREGDALEYDKYRLTVDDSGNVTYHGVTGWNEGPDVSSDSYQRVFHIPLTSSTVPDASDDQLSLEPIFQAISMSKHLSVAPELGDALLKAFFCYQHMEVVQRSTFLRDMAIGGPFFSEFLLMMIYASASRMIDGLTEEQKLAQGDLFVRLAKAYLPKELDGPSKITTIQGLLLLAMRECALGEKSQGWNHTGLAFRMMQDLGIHHAPEFVSGVSDLSQEEQSTRERLYWTGFCWDKALSLTYGREPTFPARKDADPSAIKPFDDDTYTWTPYFANPLNRPAKLNTYAYQPGFRVTGFRLMARLCLVVHEIMLNLYAGPGQSLNHDRRVREAFTTQARHQLDQLWFDTPLSIKFTPLSPSPPPYIHMYEMLYHAAYILLHRPVVTFKDISHVTGPAALCREHSVLTTLAAVHFSETFDERTYTVARYSWFVAASFDVLLLDCLEVEEQLAALQRLSIWLRIMDKNIVRATSIRRSVENISQRAADALAKHPFLASSESGRAILSYHAASHPSAQPAGAATTQSTDFFEFFDVSQAT